MPSRRYPSSPAARSSRARVNRPGAGWLLPGLDRLDADHAPQRRRVAALFVQDARHRAELRAQPVAGPAVPGGRPRVGVPGGQPHGVLALPGHHHRHPAGRRRLQRGVAQLMKASGPGDRFAAQQPDDDLQLLLEPRPSVASGNATHGVLRAGKPAPSPSTSRPPLIESTPAAILASSAGCRNTVGVTKVPSVSRAVEAPSADNSVHPSAMPSTGCPGDSDSRWSHTHAESRPTASA